MADKCGHLLFDLLFDLVIVNLLVVVIQKIKVEPVHLGSG